MLDESNAVLREGLSKVNFVAKLFFPENEGSRRLGLRKTSEKKVSENIADRRFESWGLYYSCNVHYP